MKESQAKKVLVAMSGGVDSSVAAALLKKQGYQVEGAYMQCWSEGPYCSTEVDRADALRVATQLSIPFQVFDFEKEYKDAVLNYFFAEYEKGRTPNPDVACNREIKFGVFLNKARQLGFDFVATGHYARVEYDQSLEQFKLLAASDPLKDQSYFLYTLQQEQLKHTLFPIGHYLKKEVRQIARELGLLVAEKKDSQGICFLGPVSVSTFLRENLSKRMGKVVDPDGEVLGEHDGLAFYTIGQREGLKINSNLPYYVYGKNPEKNELLVCSVGSELLFSSETRLLDPTWVSSQEPKLPLQLKVSLRYHQEPLKALLEKDKHGYRLTFKQAQRAVTSGQAAVLYEGNEVLGGGTIEQSLEQKISDTEIYTK